MFIHQFQKEKTDTILNLESRRFDLRLQRTTEARILPNREPKMGNWTWRRQRSNETDEIMLYSGANYVPQQQKKQAPKKKDSHRFDAPFDA